MNTDDTELVLLRAERRVREIQTKLHRWATDDPDQQFHDLFNLVCDPAFLLVAWPVSYTHLTLPTILRV